MMAFIQRKLYVNKKYTEQSCNNPSRGLGKDGLPFNKYCENESFEILYFDEIESTVERGYVANAA